MTEDIGGKLSDLVNPDIRIGRSVRRKVLVVDIGEKWTLAGIGKQTIQFKNDIGPGEIAPLPKNRVIYIGETRVVLAAKGADMITEAVRKNFHYFADPFFGLVKGQYGSTREITINVKDLTVKEK